MCVIEKHTGPGEQQQQQGEEEQSTSKPRFHAQGWNKSFQGTPPHSDNEVEITRIQKDDKNDDNLINDDEISCMTMRRE